MKENLCRYLCRGGDSKAACGWRLVTGLTELPEKAEIRSDEYDPALDWCIPAYEAGFDYGISLPDSKVSEVISGQLVCKQYEKLGSNFPLLVTSFPDPNYN